MRALITTVCLALPVAAAAAQSLGTFRYDPVELVKGNQVEGDEAVYADHYLFRYLFASTANKAAFEKEPQRYEIQMGGGCGRMGPLSGVGRTDLFAVHDGRIYIFASEACRGTFVKHADKLVETPDPKPDADAAAVRRARELLDKAAEAMGGAAKIEAVRSYRQRAESKVEYDGSQHDQAETITLAFPDGIHHERAWDEARYVAAGDGKRGWFTARDEARPMHPQQLAALRRTFLMRNPLAILKLRGRPGFVAAAVGADKLEAGGQTVDVEKVAVWYDGGAAELSIDVSTGRIRAVACRGRGDNMMFGRLQRVFTGFREVDGLTLPVVWITHFDGEPQKDIPTPLTSVTINDADPALIEPPAELNRAGG